MPGKTDSSLLSLARIPSLMLNEQSSSGNVQSGPSKDSLLCTLCSRQFARYTCPRCNVPYCSLTCFRTEAHNQCSEAFYKQEIEYEIRSQPSKSAEERRQMMELLKRFEENAAENDDNLYGNDVEEEDGDVDELTKRWEGVNLDDISSEELWSMLTPSEREAFMNNVNNPDSESAKELMRMAALQMKSEEPWWEASDGEEDNELDSVGLTQNGEQRRRRLPEMIEIPLGIIKPHKLDGPSLLYNICSVSIAYTYTTRTLLISPLSSKLDSKSSSDIDECRSLIGSLVPFLVDKRSQVLYQSLDEVVRDMWTKVEGMTPALFSLLLKDVVKLFTPKIVTEISTDKDCSTSTGTLTNSLTSIVSDLEKHPSAPVLYMLSDLISLFQNSSTINCNPSKIISDSPTNHITHKLRFYAAHIFSLPPPLLSLLIASLSLHAEKLQSEAAETPLLPMRSPFADKFKSDIPILEATHEVGHSLIIERRPDLEQESNKGTVRVRATDSSSSAIMNKGSNQANVSSFKDDAETHHDVEHKKILIEEL